MAKTKIKVDRSYAEEKLKAQIEKGKELVEKGSQIIGETSPDTTQRTRRRDSFKALYNQWQGFTEEILSELFVSSHYAHEFRETQSSKVEYVSSDWVPGVEYYIEKQIVPKVDYLRVLSQNLDQFRKAESDAAAPVVLPKAESVPELPDRGTLAWPGTMNDSGKGKKFLGELRGATRVKPSPLLLWPTRASQLVA